MNQDILRNSFKITQKIDNVNSDLELIKVKDEKRNQVHYILLETSTSLEKHILENSTYLEYGSISCSAFYVFGSRSDYIGKLISEMGGKVESYLNCVKIIDGGVMINQEPLRGLHIGTYQFHKIVIWAKTLNSTYRIVPVSLSVVDATDDNKDRRNSLYENFGLRFRFSVNDKIPKASGLSFEEITVGDLIAYQNWPNIEKINPYEAFKNLSEELNSLRNYNGKLKRINRNCHKASTKKMHSFRIIGMFLNWSICVAIGFAAFAAGRMLG